nr:MAG: putative RNA-dependent RNA polymerase [Mitoviridae sp.]
MYNIRTRSFSTSLALRQDKYLIGGVEMTRDQILEIRPSLRTIAHWLVLVDWDLLESRHYCVVDPFSPTSLLYLNQADYLSLGRTCVSNDLPLMVIATPSVSRPSPVQAKSKGDGVILPPGTSSQNSPLPVGFETKWTKSSRICWKTFLDFRSKVRKGVPTVKGSTMVSESPKTIAQTVLLWGRELLHYTEVKNPGGFLELLTPVARHLSVLLKHNGAGGCIKHLKVCLFILYTFMSGNPLKCSVPLGWGIRLSRGLPSYWPRALRDMIRSGNLPVIRVVASILNLYRAMDAKHPEFSTASITAPHPILEGNQVWADYQKFVSEIFPKLLSSHFDSGKLPEFKYESAYGMLIRSAGANLAAPSSASASLDAAAWAGQPENHVLNWFKMHGDHLAVQTLDAMSIEGVYTNDLDVPFIDGIKAEGPESPQQRGITANGLLMATRASGASMGKRILSRLHTIDEPAGKVRVVAICDYWTQVALKPVHEWLFSILRGLSSNDATFDQDGVTQAYFNRDLSPHWSFDLKTATDSIPIALYKAVLYPLLCKEGEDPDVVRERVDLWAKILVDRDFYLPRKEDDEGPHRSVRYNTGQPMGALSSWASMALVHHSLVQFAHWRATQREEWYANYLVLGDDVDIASLETVSTAYKETCENFHITIGLAKSLQSNMNCFEFANRRYIPQGDISPLSFREELACSTWTQRLEFAKRILRRIGKPTTEVSALLRRAVTSAQWIVLTPEMSGRRPLSVLRLVQYCLLNPLQSKDLEGLRISSVLDWLTNVVPTEDQAKLASIKVDPVRSWNLSRRIVEHLREKIFEELQRRVEGDALFHMMHSEQPGEEIDTLPLEFATVPPLGQNTPLARTIEGRIGQLPYVPDCARATIDKGVQIIDDMIHAYREADLQLSFCPPLSPVSWMYFRLSVWYTNKGILSNLLRLWNRADDMVKRLPPMTAPAYDRNSVLEPQFELNSLGEWIELWIEVVSLPKAVKLDVSKSVNYNLDYNGYRDYFMQKMNIPGAKPVVQPETIFGPLLEIATVVAEFSGVRVPNLPFFSDAKKSKNWYKSLTKSFRIFETWSQSETIVQLSHEFHGRLESGQRKALRLWETRGFVSEGQVVPDLGGSSSGT